MQLIGYDIGSSSIKAAVIDGKKGKLLASATSPHKELPIDAPRQGWAEQDPEMWWKHVRQATQKVLSEKDVDKSKIQAIGISYQMHGLVVVDENQRVLRPAIIWCDGRAVDVGKGAFQELGEVYCLEHFLNSPGNFTASRLRWVQENEPELYRKIDKFMLPGDFIAMKMTGEIVTTVSGLSEAILWDYKLNGLAHSLLEHYEIDERLVPSVLQGFSLQGGLSKNAADELGLNSGTKVSYRAGDQPNNALSLNVLNPGEAAANAGTSGVIYGVTDKPLYDKHSRVNTFVHVNHEKGTNRYGVLLCINGTGILYSWLKNQMLGEAVQYKKMNKLAANVPVGSEGLTVLPFGNGPERSLGNKDTRARILGIDFNRHSQGHVLRGAQEGIAFAMNYGLQIMKEMGLAPDKIRAGKANMFLSPVFTEAFANTSGIRVELYETDGACGAAIGAGIGAELFDNRSKAFKSARTVETVDPEPELQKQYDEAYGRWKNYLDEVVS